LLAVTCLALGQFRPHGAASKERCQMAEPTNRNKGAGKPSAKAGDKHHEPRSGPPEREPDLETAIEDEMRASGRTGVVPRSGVIGAHPSAVAPLTASFDEEVQPSSTGGQDVAPTARALERERLRHSHQSEVGVLPAGQEGRLRQERPEVDEGSSRGMRALLDAAADAADREVSPTVPILKPRNWVSRQLDRLPGGAATGVAAVGVVLLGCGIALARSRH
jgi:hypothetical protein